MFALGFNKSAVGGIMFHPKRQRVGTV